MKKLISVEGMSCEHCERAVQGALASVEGVSKVDVDLTSKQVRVEGENLKDDLLTEAIEDAGYDVIKVN